MLGLGVLVEACASLGRESKRVAPMALGIVWGVASVFVLTAIGKGFESTQRQLLDAFGDKFLLLRLNKPTESRGDPNAMNTILVEYEDIERIRANSPLVDKISPKAFVWNARATRGNERTWLRPIGVDPEYAQICNVPVAEGRWLTAADVQQELPVAVIGPTAKKELFGDEPALGKTFKLTLQNWGRPPSKKSQQKSGSGNQRQQTRGSDDLDEEQPYTRDITVIGVLKEMESSDDYYVSNKGVGFIPYPLFERISERGAGFMVFKPKDENRVEEALAQIRGALAERYHFDPKDDNTVLPYFDGITRGREIDRIFGGIRWFLGAVGLLILLLGAVGVANVVLMSVTARTFEFGLKRALGCRKRFVFAQVFLEAALVCGLSGLLGFGLGLAGVAGVGLLPLPPGFPRPVADLGAATMPAMLLACVTIGAAAWPALRAVRLDPVRALRGGAL